MRNKYEEPLKSVLRSGVRTIPADTLIKLLNSSLDVICSIDEDGRFVTVSAAASHVWGYEPIELEGAFYMDFVIEEDRVLTSIAAERIMSGLTVTNFENRYRRKDGRIVPVVWSARWDENEKMMYCVARDASEKTKAEQEVRKAHQKVRTQARRISDILASMQDGFFSMDRRWRVTYFNAMAEKLTGKKKEEVIGKVFWEVFPTTVDTIAYRKYHRALADNVQVSFEMYSQLYHNWFEVIAYPSKAGLSVYFKDISARKKQEEELRLSNQRYELISKATSDVIWDWTMASNECYFNQAFKVAFGYDNQADNIYNIWVENIHEADKERVFQSVQEALLNPEISRWEGEYRFYCKDRSVAFVLDRGFIIRDENGKAVRMVGSMQDITRVKETSEELKKLSLVATETSNVVIITDADERITWVNKAFTDVTEYTLEEALGKKPAELLQGPNTSPRRKAYLRKQIEKGLPFECEIINYSKSGREYWIDVKGQPILNERGEVEQFFAIQTDITERIELQRAVVEEKMEAQREITRAIIDTQEQERSDIAKELHDNVNQIIATIKLYLQNVGNFPEQHEMFIRKAVELSDLALKESRNLSHQLATPVIEEAGFERSLDSLLEHYRLLAVFKVDFQFTLFEERVDNGICLTIYRIVQEALNNVVKYAKATKVFVGILQEDSFIKVIVQDNGAGFDPSQRANGLGMTNIKNRAGLYKGRVEIASANGEGCKVCVFFPLVTGPSSGASQL